MGDDHCKTNNHAMVIALGLNISLAASLFLNIAEMGLNTSDMARHSGYLAAVGVWICVLLIGTLISKKIVPIRKKLLSCLFLWVLLLGLTSLAGHELAILLHFPAIALGYAAWRFARQEAGRVA